ncbi:MAG: hypothetical protein Rubg2KO_02800 [Rubricoccaceae bacterium]
MALVALGLAMSPSATAQLVGSDLSCLESPTGHIQWTSGDNVWEFDFVRPALTRTPETPNGAGVELLNVTYNGRLVFRRAGVPVLNVEYDDTSSGCSCFRDWQFEEAPFEAGEPLSGNRSCVALPEEGTVTSTCETGEGGDIGSFRGVSFEDYGTELVITSAMKAGWYRYRMKWHLYADGRIWPEFSFTAAESICTASAHRHHAYWRFDFDLDGTPANDEILEVRNDIPQVLTNEASRTWFDVPAETHWQVRDADTGFGYTIEPSDTDLLLPVDAYSKTDALALRYRENELGDGEGLCDFDFAPLANNESLDGEDVVFWYRSSALHGAGNPYECDIVGPTLRPFGMIEPLPADQPAEIEAAQPNPFTPRTSVRFRVRTEQTVRVTLHDALGRRIRDLFDGPMTANRYETVQIDGNGLATGTYVVVLRGETAHASTRVVLVR